MPKPIKTRTIYHAEWTMISTKRNERDQFNDLAKQLDHFDLELIELRWWNYKTFLAIVAGDLHGIFGFQCTLGRPANVLRSKEIRA